MNPDPRNKRCINTPARNLSNSLGRVILVPEGGTPKYTYSWTGPSINASNQTDSLVENLQPGLYSVTVTDSKGCITTYSTTLISDSNYDIPAYTVDFYDNTLCWNEIVIFENTFSGTTVDSVIFEISEVKGSVPVVTTWYADVTTSPDTIIHSIEGNSTFNYIRAINDYCYQDTNDIFVEYFPDFELDIVGPEGLAEDTVYLKGSTSGVIMASALYATGITYQWYESDVLIPQSDNPILTVNPDSSAHYSVVASTAECVDSSTVYLEFIPVITPNEGFTPNGDGINDYWRIKFIDKFPNNIVTIFNRWGVKVYEQKGYSSTDESKMWDGNSKNGKELPSGTYYFVIILNEEGFNPITGPITIIR